MTEAQGSTGSRPWHRRTHLDKVLRSLLTCPHHIGRHTFAKTQAHKHRHATTIHTSTRSCMYGTHVCYTQRRRQHEHALTRSTAPFSYSLEYEAIGCAAGRTRASDSRSRLHAPACTQSHEAARSLTHTVTHTRSHAQPLCSACRMRCLSGREVFGAACAWAVVGPRRAAGARAGARPAASRQ